MNYELQVENIKCDGCASTITNKLTALDGVNNVDIDVEKGIVRADATEGLHDTLSKALLKLGYPESGTTEGIAAAKAKAKSFVSCAVGKFGNN